jgi:K+-transporting ATPase ATPase C chain
MIREFVTSVRLAATTWFLGVVVYTLVILGFAAVTVPHSRSGSLVAGRDGVPVGSTLIAQGFTRSEYFWPRPSACGYDAAAAMGSNFSPTSPQLRDGARQILARLDVPAGTAVPADLLSASGSGLDPHISLPGALVQIPRVANRREMSENQLRRFVERHARTSGPAVAGGEPLVNVLLLNVALDAAHPTP